MKIATKNFAVISSIIFMVVTILLATLYFVMPLYYEQVKTSDTKNAFSKVVEDIEGKSQEEIVSYLTNYKQGKNQLYFTLTNGKTVLYPQIPPVSTDGEVQELELTVVSAAYLTDVQSISDTITTNDKTDLKLEAEYSLQPVTDARNILLQLYPFILCVALVIGGTGAYVYSRSSTSRIKEISATARQMSSLNPDLACTVSGKDEVATLAQDINKMYQTLLNTIKALEKEIEKVSENERSKEEFLRITSHELKTPITSMMGIIDGMILNVGDFKDRDRYLQECRRILEEQSQLVQSILAISKLEMSGAQEGRWETFSLSQLMQELMQTYQLLADMNHLELHYHLEEAVITADKTYLEKAIKNIIDNALKYSRKKGQVRIVLTPKSLMIENQAQRLLSTEELENIFTPFYRPDYSRNRKDGGTGLGLFIVQQILKQHQFEYHFENIDNEWMRFTLIFEK